MWQFMVVVVFLVAGCIVDSSESDDVEGICGTQLTVPKEQAEECVAAAGIQRPMYGKGNITINPLVFRELPPYPTDFNEVHLLYERGRLLENFSDTYPDEAYYKQPEWRPREIDMERCMKNYYTSQPQYIGVMGYGAYPGHTIVSPVRPGETLRFVTTIRADCGIVKFQGMMLQPVFNERVELRMRGVVVKEADQNPRIAERYLDVKVSPEILLLEPTYPWFHYNYSQRVIVEVEVDEDIPPGNYAVEIVAVDPPYSYIQQWTRKYRLGYINAGGMGIGAVYTVFIDVVER